MPEANGARRPELPRRDGGAGPADELASLLRDPRRAEALALAAIPAALTAAAAEHAALHTVERVLLARLLTAQAGAAPNGDGQDERGAMTQEEAAAAYRLPLRTLRFLTRTGCVPSYKLGRNRMVRPADLERYLARCREQGVPVGTILDV